MYNGYMYIPPTCRVNTCLSIYHLLPLAMFDFNFKGFVDGNYLHMYEFHANTSILALIVDVVVIVVFFTHHFTALSFVVACSFMLINRNVNSQLVSLCSITTTVNLYQIHHGMFFFYLNVDAMFSSSSDWLLLLTRNSTSDFNPFVWVAKKISE